MQIPGQFCVEINTVRDSIVMRPRQKQDHALLGSHAKPARRSLTARRSRAADRSKERHVGRSECGSSRTEAPCGASITDGRSVFGSDRLGTGFDRMAVGIHDLGENQQVALLVATKVSVSTFTLGGGVVDPAPFFHIFASRHASTSAATSSADQSLAGAINRSSRNPAGSAISSKGR